MSKRLASYLLQLKQNLKPVPVSQTGMWFQDKDVIVPSNRITMKGPDGSEDYFKEPIIGQGMQSGEVKVMQPGKEYHFPNDKQVFEKRMQGGGEMLLDLASYIPGPTGIYASGVGLVNDAVQGDLWGVGLNTANILTGGAAKGAMSLARYAANAGARNTARGLATASHTLNRASRTANNVTQPIDKARTISNTGTYLNTQRTPQRESTYVAPRPRPIMQGGGKFAVGPYDQMKAPKEGNYLLPDINRPSYIDEFGKMRSEYKMGFNDNGKEVLIPTVVQGKQLSQDEAIDNYYRTGLHMGKYDTVQDAENASALRTAKYNMLADPIRFKMSDYVPNMKVGGKIEEGEEDDDDREMVEGIADILRQVKDKDNRKQIAKKMVEDFEDEDVDYNLDNFLEASRLMQMGGMSIPGVNGTVVANTNAPSLYKKYKRK